MDSSTIHSFLIAREAQRLNLDLTKVTNHMKIVNVVIATPMGFAKGVVREVRCWYGHLDLLVLQIDNSNAILGVDFVV